MSKKIHYLLAHEQIKIVQNDEDFKFSLDSLLLADFIDCTNASKIVDLCCGNAPILLYLSLKTNANLIGVEIQERIANLAIESVLLNNLDIKIINDNLIGIYQKITPNSCDIVSCNPPYFKLDHNLKNDSINKTIARHELLVTLEQIVIEAKRLLKDGARLYLIHRTNRLNEVISTLEKHLFGIKKIRFCYSKEESNVFLIEARKNKKSDIQVLSPLHIYNGKEYSEEVLKIFNFKK